MVCFWLFGTIRSSKERWEFISLSKFERGYPPPPTTTLSTNEFLSIRRSRLLPTSSLHLVWPLHLLSFYPQRRKKNPKSVEESQSSNDRNLNVDWMAIDTMSHRMNFQSHTKRKRVYRAEIQKWRAGRRLDNDRCASLSLAVPKKKQKTNENVVIQSKGYIVALGFLDFMSTSLQRTPSFSHCYHSIERS